MATYIISLQCVDCSAEVFVPDKGMGRAQAGVWRAQHQGHNIVDHSSNPQPSMADPEPKKPSMADPEPLKVDPERFEKYVGTGIYVRALEPNGKWGNVDIAELDKASLLQWLRSRGGDNPWAEETVCLLLGHPR